MSNVFARCRDSQGRCTFLAVDIPYSEIAEILEDAGIVPPGMQIRHCHGSGEKVTMEFERKGEWPPQTQGEKHGN